jgi:hypothetical protein
LQGKLLLAAGWMSMTETESDSAVARIEASIPIWNELGDRCSLGFAEYGLGALAQE